MAVGDNYYLQLDTSALEDKIDELKAMFSDARIKKILERTIVRTGQRSRSLVSKEVPTYYEVPKSWAAKQIDRRATIEINGGMVSGTVGMNGVRGTIGGRFKAKGGNIHHPRVIAKIMKSDESKLPLTLEHQGDNPPFINLKSDRLNGVAFTRVSKNRYPIARVTGISLPQMPLNKAEDDVREVLQEYMLERLEHEINYELGFGRDGG